VTIGLAALLVTFAYFYALGHFVPWAALRALLATGEAEMTLTYNQLRSASTATGAYLGPGYVFQFKDCLLPLVTILLYFRMRVKPGAGSRIAFAFFLASTLMASVGTGSRFALAFFAAAFAAISQSSYMAPFRLRFKQLVPIALGALLVLSLLTLMMGARGQRKAIDHSILWAPLQVAERIFASPARERLVVYDLFLRDQEPRWGRGALEGLAIILPGRARYSLSNELHELLYGNPTGDVGLDFWGSLWYDFHWYGLVFIFLAGVLYNGFYVNQLRGRKGLVRVVTLGYAGFVLGLATDLQVLILRGFVTCLLFLFILAWVRLIQSALLPDPRPLASHRHHPGLAHAERP
jgi:hypothetical protein